MLTPSPSPSLSVGILSFYHCADDVYLCIELCNHHTLILIHWRPDTDSTIRMCEDLGVEIKMVTGDQKLIAAETCRVTFMITEQ